MKEYKCTISDCKTITKGRKMCRKHRGRRDRHGDPTVSRKSDRGSTVRRIRNGYVVLSNLQGHPNAWKDGDMFEHTFVMSEHLNRPLIKGENVHHKNGVKDDNRLENLELWITSQPAGQRVQDLVEWSRCVLARYGDANERKKYGD